MARFLFWNLTEFLSPAPASSRFFSSRNLAKFRRLNEKEWMMFHQQVRFQVQNGQPITALAIADDGRTLVSGGKDRAIRLWDAESGECAQHHAHQWEISGVSLSPDGNTVASVSQGKGQAKFKSDAVLWNPKTGKFIAIPASKGHAFRNPAFVSSEFAAFKYGEIRLYDVQSGENDGVIPENVVGDRFVVSLDRHQMLFGTRMGPLHLWDIENRQLRLKLEAHDAQAWLLAFDQSGTRAASYGAGQLCLWDLSSGRLQQELWLDLDMLCIGFCSQTSTWLCVDATQGISRFDLEGKLVEVISLHGKHSLICAAWLGDQSLLALGTSEGTITLGKIEA